MQSPHEGLGSMKDAVDLAVDGVLRRIKEQKYRSLHFLFTYTFIFSPFNFFFWVRSETSWVRTNKEYSSSLVQGTSARIFVTMRVYIFSDYYHFLLKVSIKIFTLHNFSNYYLPELPLKFCVKINFHRTKMQHWYCFLSCAR